MRWRWWVAIAATGAAFVLWAAEHLGVQPLVKPPQPQAEYVDPAAP